MGSPLIGKAFLEFLVSQREQDSSGDSRCFDTTALEGITDVKAESGRLTCRMPVTQKVQNRYGTLHGGCIATLVDTVGSAALVTVSKRSGVSLNINVDYLSPMPGGGTVLVDAKVVKVGKAIATINVQLKDEATGRVVAQGSHVKFMADNEPELSEQFKSLSAQPRAKL